MGLHLELAVNHLQLNVCKDSWLWASVSLFLFMLSAVHELFKGFADHQVFTDWLLQEAMLVKSKAFSFTPCGLTD